MSSTTRNILLAAVASIGVGTTIFVNLSGQGTVAVTKLPDAGVEVAPVDAPYLCPDNFYAVSPDHCPIP